MTIPNGGGFGSGLGGLIGGVLGHDELDKGQSRVDDVSKGFQSATQPYNSFGQSFLNPASGMIGDISNHAGSDPNLNYNTFMKNYQGSPGQDYSISQANTGQNSSAAAHGGLLSGANERALGTIDTGIANQFANQAYGNYLQGNQQQFGQLESALGNMFQAIGVGTTATGQQAGVDMGQMSADSQLAQAQAKNDQAKGGGLGSMFSGLSIPGIPMMT